MFLTVYKPPPLILSYSAGNVHTGLLVLYVIVRYIRNVCLLLTTIPLVKLFFVGLTDLFLLRTKNFKLAPSLILLGICCVSQSVAFDINNLTAFITAMQFLSFLWLTGLLTIAETLTQPDQMEAKFDSELIPADNI